MKSKGKIHNLDTLEKEILRLQLLSKQKEEKMGRQFSRIREKAGSLLTGSFCAKKQNGQERKNRFRSWLSEKLGDLVDRIFTGQGDPF